MVPGDRDPAPVPVPDTTPSSATGAVTTTPKAPARRTHANGAHANAVRSSDSKPDDIRASDITTADIKRSDIRSSDSKPGEREPGDSKSDRKRGARPTGPRPADERGNSWTVRGAPATGVDPSALSELYSTTAKVLAGLPSDKARDLRELFRRYNVLALVAAPQAERDEAAAQLSQILREARLRQDKPSAPRTDPRRQRTGPAPRA
jgi:hypothetical protein